jgi:sugar phosphate isomerase/epimerase
MGTQPGVADPLQLTLDTLRALVREHGVQVIELSLDELLLHQALRTPEAWAAIGGLQQELAVPFTVHLPFLWIDISSADELIREVSVRRMAESVRLTQALDVQSYVVHATGMLGEVAGPTVTNPEADLRVQVARRSINRSFGDLREHCPAAPFAIENLPGIPYEWQAEFVVQHDLGVCCDVGHLLLQLRDPIAFIEQWSDRLLQVHLHGVREVAFTAGLRLRRDHQALGGPGEVVDVPRVIEALRRAAFSGPLVLEVNSADDLARSLETLRAVSPPGSPAIP